MPSSNRFWLRAAPVLVTLAAVACTSGNSQSPTFPGQNGTMLNSAIGGTANSTGTLTVRLTDSPFSDAKALLVTFSDVSVYRADTNAWVTLPFAGGASSLTCDLKKLSSASDVLGAGPLAARPYTNIRLTVASATLYFGSGSVGGPCGAQAPSFDPGASVAIPSGEVTLTNEFTVTPAGTTMLLDFDGDQSVRQTGSGDSNGGPNSDVSPKYMMSPVIHVVSVQ